mmetsp:Transcript_19232/g.56027  ORF Transcript_19232/g.56027 Transcript_19232/m.56027 type:complete len:231 (-) Transcript_19232:83-775(-)
MPPPPHSHPAPFFQRPQPRLFPCLLRGLELCLAPSGLLPPPPGGLGDLRLRTLLVGTPLLLFHRLPLGQPRRPLLEHRLPRGLGRLLLLDPGPLLLSLPLEPLRRLRHQRLLVPAPGLHLGLLGGPPFLGRSLSAEAGRLHDPLPLPHGLLLPEPLLLSGRLVLEHPQDGRAVGAGHSGESHLRLRHEGRAFLGGERCEGYERDDSHNGGGTHSFVFERFQPVFSSKVIY